MEELGDDHTRVSPRPGEGCFCKLVGNIGNRTRSIRCGKDGFQGMGDVRPRVSVGDREHIDRVDHLHVLPETIKAKGQGTIEIFPSNGHARSLPAEKLNFGSVRRISRCMFVLWVKRTKRASTTKKTSLACSMG
ncbi:hypothetical protein SDC9_146981 [bioreactor metagenome]|uniref:Uncharacterized protein n=1 Tax=bioreactor metagenome TaxID=1076179 RepID=A0A645ECT6_9ZZZZ